MISVLVQLVYIESFYAGQVEVVLGISVPHHFWNLPKVQPGKVSGLLKSL